jgi:hypothetical protein
MFRLIAWISAGAEIVAVLAAIRFGIVGATESVGTRKGTARFAATLLFGICLCLPAFCLILLSTSLPVFESDGTISSMRLVHSGSRHYSAYLLIQTPASGEISVHASDPSIFFRPGQRLRVRYQAETGEVLKVWFFNASGNQEARFNSTLPLAPYGLLLSGAFAMFAAFRIRQRDPEGREEPVHRSSGLSTAVDEQSILDLSRNKPCDNLWPESEQKH